MRIWTYSFWKSNHFQTVGLTKNRPPTWRRTHISQEAAAVKTLYSNIFILPIAEEINATRIHWVTCKTCWPAKQSNRLNFTFQAIAASGYRPLWIFELEGSYLLSAKLDLQRPGQTMLKFFYLHFHTKGTDFNALLREMRHKTIVVSTGMNRTVTGSPNHVEHCVPSSTAFWIISRGRPRGSTQTWRHYGVDTTDSFRHQQIIKKVLITLHFVSAARSQVDPGTLCAEYRISTCMLEVAQRIFSVSILENLSPL